MLAPNPIPETNPSAPINPPPKKRRTITLTNRAPVSIIEEDWPVIAESKEGETCEDWPETWEITFRVRDYRHGDRVIVHAGYVYSNDMNETYQKVRVGRLLVRHTEEELWKAILETSEELRERIDLVNVHKHIRGVVDRLFAELPAHGIF